MSAPVVQRVADEEPPAGRTPTDRLLARFPGLYPAAGRILLALSPRSRIRQVVFRRQLLSGWAAASRGDFELMYVRYAPEIVYDFDPGMATLGLPPRTEGRPAMEQAIRDWFAAWEEWRFRLRVIVDLGVRLVNLGDFTARGATSSAGLQIEYVQVLDFERGVVVHERDFIGWRDGMEAAGLDAATIARVETALADRPAQGRRAVTSA